MQLRRLLGISKGKVPYLWHDNLAEESATIGYSVSTVGYDQENVRVYIEKQEKLDKNY